MTHGGAIHGPPAGDQQFVLALLLIRNRYVLQLRDNIPTIAAPGMWGLFGGRIESGERPEEALVREIGEELCIHLVNYRPWGTVDAHSEFSNRLARYWIFEADVECCWADHQLREGQDARDFPFEELEDLPVHQLVRQLIESHHRAQTSDHFTQDRTMKVPFSYLERQFANIDPYLEDIRRLMKTTDLTLGAPVREFEKRFAELCGIPHAIGVGTGTDAIAMSLKVLGIGDGDEVITTPTTFIATVGAIVMTGARPVFVDSEDGFVIDPSKIEAAITPRTKAIVPVHYTGNVADMPAIMEIASGRNLLVVEDACQAIMASLGGKPVGSWGETACFSLHPLKNLNVWGDGGVIVTRSQALADKLRLYRNHGLVNRDEVHMFGINCRLDSLHAVIGNRLISEVRWITDQRVANAKRYDDAFVDLGEFVRVPKRRHDVMHVYHLYMLRVRDRDRLLSYLHEKGVDAKVHYPVPVHLQPAAAHLGYRSGDFPKSEGDSKSIITLPGHQHLSAEEIEYTVQSVMSFYKSR